jgi:hypothetical protein
MEASEGEYLVALEDDGILPRRILPSCQLEQTDTPTHPPFTDKKENQIFLVSKEIQNGAVAKSYMRKGFLIYEEMRKFLTIFEEAVSHI